MRALVAALFLLAAVHAHADGIFALRTLPDDKTAVRNGALLFARIEVEVLNASESQAKLPIAIGLFPKDKRSVDFLATNGMPFTADGFWMPLLPGKNLILVSPPPGAYYWRSIQSGGARTTYSAPVQKEGEMSIAPNSVTYVGDLKVTIDFKEMLAKSSIVEATQDAMQELKVSRPALLEAFEPKVSLAILGKSQ